MDLNKYPLLQSKSLFLLEETILYIYSDPMLWYNWSVSELILQFSLGGEKMDKKATIEETADLKVEKEEPRNLRATVS